MLYPDPMGSLFADAAVSLLRKLTFKGKWALAFCNIDSPKHTLITTNSFPFFYPLRLNVCSLINRVNLNKNVKRTGTPHNNQMPTGRGLVTHPSLVWKHLDPSEPLPTHQSEIQIMCLAPHSLATQKLPILCQRGQSTDIRETNEWTKYTNFPSDTDLN